MKLFYNEIYKTLPRYVLPLKGLDYSATWLITLVLHDETLL